MDLIVGELFVEIVALRKVEREESISNPDDSGEKSLQEIKNK